MNNVSYTFRANGTPARLPNSACSKAWFVLYVGTDPVRHVCGHTYYAVRR
jgi:hypothetical protein